MTNNDPDDISMLPTCPDEFSVLEAYKFCRMKLVRANRSRSALKGHDDRRRDLILELQAQLEDLEVNLSEEAASKAQIHELNARIAELLKVMEVGNDEIADIVEEREGDTGITQWVIRLARLLPIVFRLRDIKARASQLLGLDTTSDRYLPPNREDSFQEISLNPPTYSVDGDVESTQDKHELDDWRTWNAQVWNERLLDYCFFRYPDEPAWAGIPATEEELRNVTGDASGNSMHMAERLIESLVTQAKQRRHSDGRSFTPGEFFQNHAKNYRHRRDRVPPYFAFLWLTCLIAQGYPNPQEEGEFHARYERVFGRRENQQLRLLPTAWKELELWLSLEDETLGTPHRRLELPPVDPGRRLISHSWKLSFPRRSDRKRLQDGFSRYAAEGKLDPCSLDLLEFLHDFGGFARPFTAELDDHLSKIRSGEASEDWFTGILRREISAWSAPFPDGAEGQQEVFGSLLLRLIPGDGFGVLVLEDAVLHNPGFVPADGEAFGAPGRRILVDAQAEDSYWSGFDVGRFVLDRSRPPFHELSRSLDEGLLIFAADPKDGLPRLLLNSSAANATHVLLDETQAEEFLELFGGSEEGCIEDRWTCVRGFDADAADLLAFRRGQPPKKEQGPGLLPIGGIPYLSGWLPTQLGLPWIRVRGSTAPEDVVLTDQAGHTVVYNRSRKIGEEDLWKPSTVRSAIARLIDGGASFEASMPGSDQKLRRRLTIRALSRRPKFLRQQKLAIREDWGRHLGPLICESTKPLEPPAEALHKAIDLVGRGDRANPALERELLDALCARFLKCSGISRLEFFRLYRRLDPNTDARQEWPLLMEGFLRAWCEGGWLEEGLEERRFRWRIHPIDPRLVCRPDGKARLVGLTSSADLLAIIAWSIALGTDPPRAIKPANPRLPRGWEFSCDLPALAANTGLPLVIDNDWVCDITTESWKVEPMECDGPEWPPSPHEPMTHQEQICGRRKGAHIARDVRPDQRPNSATSIFCEEQGVYRRRWRTDGRKVFYSSIRNRVCLAAAAHAAKGSWPFGFVDNTRIERLFDYDAYLPLPIGRAAALLGAEMPGPTLRDRPSHTHRYVLNLPIISALHHRELVPLTLWEA
jgi:hypothetical protein